MFARACVSLFAAILVSATLQAQQLTRLRVSLGSLTDNRLPYIIAQEEGIYRKYGLEVQLFVTPAAAEAAKQEGITIHSQYISNDTTPAPIEVGGTMVVIIARATDVNAPDEVTLATVESGLRYHVVAQPEITRLEQLKGKRFAAGAPGALNHFATRVVVERMGWDPVRDVSLMIPGPNLTLLKERKVDAMVLNELRYAAARTAGFKSLAETASWNVSAPGSGLTISRAWLRDNRDTALRFLKSALEGIALMKRDQEVARRTIAKAWGLTRREAQDLILAGVADIPRKPYPSVEGIKKAMQIYDSNEMRKYKPEDFYEDSILRELDQSGFIDGLYR